MNPSQSTFENVDLLGQVSRWWEWWNAADPWLLGLIVTMAVGLGYKMSFGQRWVFSWGLRLAALVLLIHGGVVVYQEGFQWDALPTQLSRSALLAGLVLALAWILLPLLSFVYWYGRVGLAGFVVYGGYEVLTKGPIEQEALPELAGRCGIAALLAMVVAWIVHPFWAALAWPRRSSGGHHEEAEEEARRQRRLLRKWAQLLMRAQAGVQGMDAAALHAWFLEEQRRIQELDLSPGWRQARLQGLLEMYTSLTQRLMGEVDVTPVLIEPAASAPKGRAALDP